MFLYVNLFLEIVILIRLSFGRSPYVKWKWYAIVNRYRSDQFRYFWF